MGYTQTVVFERPNYITAIVGFDSVGERLIYDYDKMVEYLEENENMDTETANDFVSNDTMRALPYMGEKRPIILEEIDF